MFFIPLADALMGSIHLPPLQLALSPSPRTPSEPIPVQSSQQLSLKVEGVVQHGSTPGLFRKIQAVCLNVTSVLQSKTGTDFKVHTPAAGQTLVIHLADVSSVSELWLCKYLG